MFRPRNSSQSPRYLVTEWTNRYEVRGSRVHARYAYAVPAAGGQARLIAVVGAA